MAGPNKDAYYFPHFSNARHDRKIKRLRKELGIEGYGIFFMILEVLRDQEDFSYPMSDIDLLSDEFNTSMQKVEVVITQYKLFKIDDDKFFYSPKLIEYLKPYLERSKRARDAAMKRWHGSSDANALPKHYDSNAKRGEKSKKEKKDEIDKIELKRPSLQIIREYFISHGYDTQIAVKAFNHYEELSVGYPRNDYWRDKHGNIIENWKEKLQNVWFNPENRINSNAEGRPNAGAYIHLD